MAKGRLKIKLKAKVRAKVYLSLEASYLIPLLGVLSGSNGELLCSCLQIAFLLLQHLTISLNLAGLQG